MGVRGSGGGGVGWSSALRSGCAPWRGAGTHSRGRRASARRGRRRAASSGGAVGAEPEHHPLLHSSSVSLGGASGDPRPGGGERKKEITADRQNDGRAFRVTYKSRVRRLSRCATLKRKEGKRRTRVARRRFLQDRRTRSNFIHPPSHRHPTPARHRVMSDTERWASLTTTRG